jgi:hypothetical protein
VLQANKLVIQSDGRLEFPSSCWDFERREDIFCPSGATQNVTYSVKPSLFEFSGQCQSVLSLSLPECFFASCILYSSCHHFIIPNQANAPFALMALLTYAILCVVNVLCLNRRLQFLPISLTFTTDHHSSVAGSFVFFFAFSQLSSLPGTQ